MSKLTSLTNRLRRISMNLPPKKPEQIYIIDNGHITLTDSDEACLLCGDQLPDKDIPCPKRLSNKDLQLLIKDEEKDFMLFIWHKTPCRNQPYDNIVLPSDVGMEYEGFHPIEGLSSYNVTVKFFRSSVCE